MKAVTLHQPWATLCVLTNPTTGIPYKTIETRSWPAPGKMIGQRFAIHSAARTVRQLSRDAHPMMVGPSINGGDRYLWPEGMLGVEASIALPRGTVVGTVKLAAVVPMVGYRPSGEVLAPEEVNIGDADGWMAPNELPAARQWPHPQLAIRGAHLHLSYPGYPGEDMSGQAPFGDFLPGRWAWILTEPIMFDPPVPATGRQRIWNLPPELGYLAARGAITKD